MTFFANIVAQEKLLISFDCGGGHFEKMPFFGNFSQELRGTGLVNILVLGLSRVSKTIKKRRFAENGQGTMKNDPTRIIVRYRYM